jgi:hypothetical protein
VSCSDDPAAPEQTEAEVTLDFEAAWQAARDMYPLFTFKGIDWDEVYRRYRPRAEQTDVSEVYDFLDDLLGELKDAHVYYEHPLLVFAFPFTPERLVRDYEAFSLVLVDEYIDYGLFPPVRRSVSYGATGDNIGYIHLSTLTDPDMRGDFYDAMVFVRDTDGLILDLRRNLGGIPENVDLLISRFIETPLASYEGYTVDGPVDLPPYQPDTTRVAYTKPVVILINGACSSAPEAVAELLQRLPNVTLLGATTAGAGCWAFPDTPGTVTLPSGRVVYIPTAYMVRQDGEPWEWNGIVPDVDVVQTRDHVVLRIDSQLERAIELLK